MCPNCKFIIATALVLFCLLLAGEQCVLGQLEQELDSTRASDLHGLWLASLEESISLNSKAVETVGENSFKVATDLLWLCEPSDEKGVLHISYWQRRGGYGANRRAEYVPKDEGGYLIRFLKPHDGDFAAARVSATRPDDSRVIELENSSLSVVFYRFMITTDMNEFPKELFGGWFLDSAKTDQEWLKGQEVPAHERRDALASLEGASLHLSDTFLLIRWTDSTVSMYESPRFTRIAERRYAVIVNGRDDGDERLVAFITQEEDGKVIRLEKAERPPIIFTRK